MRIRLILEIFIATSPFRGAVPVDLFTSTSFIGDLKCRFVKRYPTLIICSMTPLSMTILDDLAGSMMADAVCSELVMNSLVPIGPLRLMVRAVQTKSD